MAVFTVDAVRSNEKADFPTLDVYGNTPDAQLRLITGNGQEQQTAHGLTAKSNRERPGPARSSRANRRVSGRRWDGGGEAATGWRP
ncbi:hypothetical protein ABZ901_20935 [Actinacidiphila alni]|uniref:hypothetical protein n=1 Tax=Actinacidiphila alni TaxID=380248 RepID=UPI0033D3DE02